MNCKVVITLGALAFCSGFVEAEPLGLWIATSDASSELRSVVELIVQDNVMSGRIERVIDSRGNEVDVVCSDCPGNMKDKPLKGMVFIAGLRKSGTKWVAGRVVNLEPGPLRGVTASCEIEIQGGEVHFFGYKGLQLFGRRVIWKPYFPGLPQ